MNNKRGSTLKRKLGSRLQGRMINQKLIILIISICMPFAVIASNTCQGRFVNPISDICWSCLMPISIGGFNIGKGSVPKKRDTQNPNLPVCLCSKNNIPIPGIAIGFWEPVRLIDVTRTPFCLTNLGGLQVSGDHLSRVSNYARGYDKHHAHRSFYHVHYYIYPLIYWLELITDFICLEQNSFDVVYFSEADPTWNDEKLQSIVNPEVFLFGGSLEQAACVVDCAASTISLPRDEMFWCAGCLGNIYPFSGANADHVGGVQASSLYATRIIAKMHRLGLAQETSTYDGSMNGKICRKSRAMKIKKSQYKLQMTNPRPTTGSGDIGCWFK